MVVGRWRALAVRPVARVHARRWGRWLRALVLHHRFLDIIKRASAERSVRWLGALTNRWMEAHDGICGSPLAKSVAANRS